jgi:hypothetical protein
LHQLTPTYFVPKTPTLYSQKELAKNLVLVRIDANVLLDSVNSFVFTDGNAASTQTKSYTNLQYLKEVPWNVIHAERWTDFYDGTRKRNAEMLISPNISSTYIREIIVSDESTFSSVNRLGSVQSHEARVTIRPDLFFAPNSPVNETEILSSKETEQTNRNEILFQDSGVTIRSNTIQINDSGYRNDDIKEVRLEIIENIRQHPLNRLLKLPFWIYHYWFFLFTILFLIYITLFAFLSCNGNYLFVLSAFVIWFFAGSLGLGLNYLIFVFGVGGVFMVILWFFFMRASHLFTTKLVLILKGGSKGAALEFTGENTKHPRFIAQKVSQAIGKKRFKKIRHVKWSRGEQAHRKLLLWLVKTSFKLALILVTILLLMWLLADSNESIDRLFDDTIWKLKLLRRRYRYWFWA